MAKLVAGNKHGGLTFAIEAGSQRLRDVINKNVSDDDIDNAVKLAFKQGWNRAKLYFMIGLPTETDDDLIAIANMCEHVLEIARQSVEEKRKHSVSVSVSCAIFVPKPQTPFMFDGQISIAEANRRLGLIRKNLVSKAINFSWHSPYTSQIEAVLSRGGRECSNLIYKAWENGACFDAWNDHFNYQYWEDAANSLNMNLEKMAGWSTDIVQEDYDCKDFPWSHIDFGVDEKFFVSERLKADKSQKTPDCSFEGCVGCGACKNLNLDLQIAGERKC